LLRRSLLLHILRIALLLLWMIAILLLLLRRLLHVPIKGRRVVVRVARPGHSSRTLTARRRDVHGWLLLLLR
jgi:hypothetical protein